MYKIYLYVIGFIIGIFLLMSLLNFNFTKYNEKEEVSSLENEDEEDNSDKLLIIEDFEDDVQEYDNEDERNYVNCNANIINNFKIDRLLNKHYLVTLISSYNEDNYDKFKKIWNLDNKNALHSKDGNVKLDNNPEYIKFPLKPEIGGFNITNITIEIKPNYIQDELGMKWKYKETVPNDFIEIENEESNKINDDTNKYKRLHNSISSGKTNFTKKEVKTFPKILHNSYIEINKKKYTPIIDNLDILKNISFLFTIKLNSIEGDMGQLLYLGNSDSGNLISINIINSNNINVNKIDKECKEDVNCKKIIENIQNSINIHNNYYENNSISNSQFQKYLAKKCDGDLFARGEYVIDKKMCEHIEKTYNDEIIFYNQLYVKKKYTIQIKINTYTYNIYDVSEDIFNNEHTFMALLIDENDITFYINEMESSFKKKDDEELRPLYPYVINNNKNCDIILYSFAIFNNTICEADIHAYKLYNYYYLYGINNDD